MAAFYVVAVLGGAYWGNILEFLTPDHSGSEGSRSTASEAFCSRVACMGPHYGGEVHDGIMRRAGWRKLFSTRVLWRQNERQGVSPF